ncbi:MAG: LuxR C-terminal-related transcriptional regulator [Acidimicrobiales bacterium]
MTDVAAQARAAYGRRDWAEAARRFEEASHGGGELAADDLFALADATWWLGDVERSISAGEAAYRRYLQGDQPTSAAMAAMGVAVNLLLRGDLSLGSGWMSRAVRLVADQPGTVEHHYLRYLTEVDGMIDEAGTLDEAGLDGLVFAAAETRAAGQRFGDANLIASGTMAEGRMLLKAGRVGEGLRLLDEAMVCLLSEEMGPEWAGSVYCHLMAASHEVGDLARAREWTEATERWLETLPAAVLFRGICRVHRSQVLQTLGAWDRAEAEAARVGEELAAVSPANAAEGHYQVGELRRLRGDWRGAEAAYQRSHERGRDPQPGLALVRLAQGRAGVALPMIRAALVAKGNDRLACHPLRVAQVEIAVAAGELDEAAQAAAAVDEVAGRYRTSGFVADALLSRGTVELAAGRPETALPPLRDACRRWRELGADYHAARACLLLAATYELLGSEDVAEMERAAGQAVFDRLGVATAESPPLPSGLTERESEVLVLVAAGRSNRDIAGSLVISEKTVARHLSNIFTKIGVGSRTEAAAYAFNNGLVRGS